MEGWGKPTQVGLMPQGQRRAILWAEVTGDPEDKGKREEITTPRSCLLGLGLVFVSIHKSLRPYLL